MNEPKLGVALTKCYYCGEGDRIVLNKLLTPSMAAKVEKMNGCVMDMKPCQKCASFMKQGIILLTIDSEKSEPGWNKPPSMDQGDPIYRRPSERRQFMPNPYRTGGFFVLKDEAIERLLGPGPMLDHAKKHRFMFIEHRAAEDLGFFAQGIASVENGDGN
jgi:hypothetical protein